MRSWSFHFQLPLKILNVGEGSGKLQKFEYLDNENNILNEIKSIFRTFLRTFLVKCSKK